MGDTMPRAPTLIVLTATLAGCLTTKVSSSVVERSPTGLEDVVDASAAHLVANESLEGGQLVLSVSSAVREHELQGYEVNRTSTDGREWAPGGKLARNVMFVGSAAATWVGLFGVGFETAEGRWIQIGGLGEDGKPASAVGALVAALGGLGVGTQQTVATKRTTGDSTVIRQELDWLATGSVESSPLAEQALDLLLRAGRETEPRELLDLATDSDGLARLDALSLPGSTWSSGHQLMLQSPTDGLEGAWSPDGSIRQRLLELPADWSTNFHSSLLQDLASLSQQAGSLVSPALDPSVLPGELAALTGELVGRGNAPPANPNSPEVVRGYLELYPAEHQAALAAAWAQQLETRLEAVAASREQASLEWLRNSAKVAGVNGENLATGAMDLSLLPPELLTPLFQPGELFRGLPDSHKLDGYGTTSGPDLDVPSRGAALTRSQAGVGRYMQLGPEQCSFQSALGPQRPGVVPLRCELDDGRAVQVVAEAGSSFFIRDALAWSMFGQVSGVRQIVHGESEEHSTLLVLRPLYAASLSRSSVGQGTFIWMLDEQGLLDSGVLRLLDPL